MKRSKCRRLHLALGLALLGITALGAQTSTALAQTPEEKAAGESQVFVDSVDVNVVNVEVYVTDKEGRRVSGLTRDDFELLEDGRPVTITNFYAVEDGAAQAPPAASAPEPGGGMEIELPQLQAEVPEDQRLHLVLYFDNQFLDPGNRNRVIRQVRQFLHSTLRPADRVMLLTYERSLHVRHPFTSDPRALAEALFEVEKLTGFAAQASTERNDVLRRVESADNAFEATSHVDFYAKSVYEDLQRSVGKLKELVGSLAGLRGRKALLYVSDGIPMTAGEDLFLFLDQQYRGGVSGQLQASRYDARRLFRELTAQANANRVTFYTLDAGGLRSHASLSAENRGTAAGGSFLEIDTLNTANRQEPLQVMAADTGGLAALNTNNLDDAFAAMATDFRTYYSLGYEPATTGDGRYHDVEVRVVGRNGLKVRHRAGYRDKSLETRLSDGTLAALLYGYETNPLEVALAVAAPRQVEEGNYRVPIEVKIPIGRMAFLPHETFYRGSLRVAIGVVNAEGDTSPVEQTRVPLEIPSADIERARGQYYVYAVELLMREGVQRVAVAVYDELAGETSFIRRSVKIGA